MPNNNEQQTIAYRLGIFLGSNIRYVVVALLVLLLVVFIIRGESSTGKEDDLGLFSGIRPGDYVVIRGPDFRKERQSYFLSTLLTVNVTRVKVSDPADRAKWEKLDPEQRMVYGDRRVTAVHPEYIEFGGSYSNPDDPNVGYHVLRLNKNAVAAINITDMIGPPFED